MMHFSSNDMVQYKPYMSYQLFVFDNVEKLPLIMWLDDSQCTCYTDNKLAIDTYIAVIENMVSDSVTLEIKINRAQAIH